MELINQIDVPEVRAKWIQSFQDERRWFDEAKYDLLGYSIVAGTLVTFVLSQSIVISACAGTVSGLLFMWNMVIMSRQSTQLKIMALQQSSK